MCLNYPVVTWYDRSPKEVNITDHQHLKWVAKHLCHLFYLDLYHKSKNHQLYSLFYQVEMLRFFLLLQQIKWRSNTNSQINQQSRNCRVLWKLKWVFRVVHSNFFVVFDLLSWYIYLFSCWITILYSTEKGFFHCNLN